MKKTRNNIVIHEDDWRNSQTYQLTKSEVLGFIKRQQSTNIGAVSREFKNFNGDLADILSDLQVEKQIEIKEGPPSKIVFIGNIKRQSKEFPKSNQNNSKENIKSKNIGINRHKYYKATPIYVPFERKQTY